MNSLLIRHLNDEKVLKFYNEEKFLQLEKYLSRSKNYELKDGFPSHINWISFFKYDYDYEACYKRKYTPTSFPFFNIRNVLPASVGICAVKENGKKDHIAIVNDFCRIPLKIQANNKKEFPSKNCENIKKIFSAVKSCIETLINQAKRNDQEYVITIYGILESRIEILDYIPKFYSYSLFMGFHYFKDGVKRDMEIINEAKLLKE